ncbi:MAG: RHS repeat protein, partial [Burkholderiaceae bacterium]|nr:RHS repeat protein [Burkholderiaceae bacterium]
MSLRLAALLAALALPQAAQACSAGNPSSCASDMTSQPASSADAGPATGAGDPIDLASGNNYRADVDYRLPATDGLALSRHYNSHGRGSGALGGGWQLGTDASLTLLAPIGGRPRVQITQGDGRPLTFTTTSAQIGEGRVPRDGATLLSALPSDGGVHYDSKGWTWRWQDGRSLRFGRQGLLLWIDDGHGERLELGHDSTGRLLGWRDQVGHSVRLVYQGMGQFDQSNPPRGRLIEAVLPDGGKIHYHYDPQGQLKQVDEADGRQLRYTYR